MSQNLFYFVVLTVFISTYTYMAVRIGRHVSNTRYKLITYCIFLIFSLFPFLTFYIRFQTSVTKGIELISWVNYIAVGFFSLLFAYLISADVIKLTGYLINRVGEIIKIQKKTPVEQKRGFTRKAFLSLAGHKSALVASALLTGYGLVEARSNAEVVTVDIPIRDMPTALENLKIVQITDIHVGATIKGTFLDPIVRTVNSLKPDIVVLTGDLVDGSVQSLREEVAPLANIRSTFGTFFITGNHEYYSGVGPWIKELRRIGMDVLLNEHRIIEYKGTRLALAGVTDYSGGRFNKTHISSPEKALAKAPESDLTILLAHQPRSVFKAEKEKIDLMICGHTHGGQYVPWNLMVGLFQPYVAGLYNHKGMWLYVSRGTGYWGPPLRVGVPAEITQFKFASVR